MHARQQNNAETGVTSERPVLLSFPGGVVKPHEAERWQRSLQSVQVAERLTDVAAGKLPHRATVYNFAAQRDLPRVNGAVFAVQEPNESES